MNSDRKYRCKSKFYKDCEEFLSFVFSKYFSPSRFSLNVGCMNLYLISLEFGLCLIGSEASGIEDFS